MLQTPDTYAGIEYRGTAGITSHCLEAIIHLVHSGVAFKKVYLLTADHDHAFLFHVDCGRALAIKAGFGSGYPGEGSRGLAKALWLLERHCEDIDEIEVSSSLIDRLDASCLSQKDLDHIESSRAVRPQRWFDYIFEQYRTCDRDDDALAELFPTAVPYSILDSRLIDLALTFESAPDSAISKGYRRLEDCVRRRIGGSDNSSYKLMSEAFISKKGAEPLLYWPDIHPTEQFGRAQLFTAVFQAFRNHRAHTEKEDHKENDLREFLLLNQLFILEGKAKERM